MPYGGNKTRNGKQPVYLQFNAWVRVAVLLREANNVVVEAPVHLSEVEAERAPHLLLERFTPGLTKIFMFIC